VTASKRHIARPDAREGGAREKALAPQPVAQRDPCARCNVRADLHDAAGCGKFAPRVAVGALAL